MGWAKQIGRAFLIACLISLLAACGAGGGGDDGIEGTGLTVLEGTAALGAPLKQKKIFIKDKNGARVQTTTNDQGYFKAPVAGMTPPFVLKTNIAGNRSLYSTTLTSGSVNLHPLTDWLTRTVFESRGSNVETEFAADDGFENPPTEEILRGSFLSITKLLGTAYQQFQVSADFDFLHGKFETNQLAFDGLLDHLQVIVSGGNVSVRVTDPTTQYVINVVINLSLSTDLSQPDTNAPTTPTGLRPIPASDKNIVVVWDAATDNIGIAGYHVYRGDIKLATVLGTSYSETGLSAATSYCYRVQAFDGAGNVSSITNSACASTLSQSDTTPPAQVQGLVANVLSSTSIALNWTPSVDSDVTSYNVFRGPNKIATVISTGYSDPSLDSATNYCYTVQAIDAANNLSVASTEACATTSSPTIQLDTDVPTTTALPVGGTYQGTKYVALSCYDNGGSGCAAILYTIDGTAPTVNSSVYGAPIVVKSNTTLRYIALDNAGNITEVKQESYVIETPVITDFQLNVINKSVSGVVVSDKAGINCGNNCTANYTLNTSVVLTASHPNGLAAVWGGCEQSTGNQCTVTLNRDRTITVSFENIANENASNDSFESAQLITDASTITGYYDAANDLDFYRIEVTERGTFRAILSHPSIGSYLAFYNEQKQQILAPFGTSVTISYSLVPGIYYIKVQPYSGFSQTVAYHLEVSGTVLGTTSPDTFEENDIFEASTPITGAGTLNGYYDTQNDPDFYSFTVTKRGTFQALLSHSHVGAYLVLYNEQKQQILAPFGTTVPISRSLSPGKYYLKVVPYNGYNWGEAYGLNLAGTVLGANTPDSHEENDSFDTATQIISAGTLHGYYDTDNDEDYYKFTVTSRGTFKATLSHPTINAYLGLFDEQRQNLVKPFGSAPTVTYSLSPGVYYLQVQPYTGHDLGTRYSLELSGTVMGTASPDVYEENDTYDSATPISGVRTFKGYFDTMNDPDFYTFTVTKRGTFSAEISHPDRNSYLHLLDGAKQVVKSTYGTAHTLTYSLTPGTYYLEVIPNGVFNLSINYTLKFSGSVLGVASPDTHEENDVFETATAILQTDSISGYFDTSNDTDYFTFTVGAAGTYSAAVAHSKVPSYLRLYGESKQLITSTYGTAHTLTRALAPGKYYLLVVPNNNYDLSESYSLTTSYQSP